MYQVCCEAGRLGCPATRTVLRILGDGCHRGSILVRGGSGHTHRPVPEREAERLEDDVPLELLMRSVCGARSLAPGPSRYGFHRFVPPLDPSARSSSCGSREGTEEEQVWECRCKWRDPEAPRGEVRLTVCGEVQTAGSSGGTCCVRCKAPRWDGPHGQLRQRVRSVLMQEGGAMLTAAQVHARVRDMAGTQAAPSSAPVPAETPSVGLLLPSLLEVKEEIIEWIRELNEQRVRVQLYGGGSGSAAAKLQAWSFLPATLRGEAGTRPARGTSTAAAEAKPISAVSGGDAVLALPVVRLQGAVRRWLDVHTDHAPKSSRISLAAASSSVEAVMTVVQELCRRDDESEEQGIQVRGGGGC